MLNEGHYEPTLKMFATDATLAFPGANSWSRMFREPQLGSEARVHHWAKDEHGRIVYSNRAVLFVRSRWGKITEQEDYEDTTRVAAFDAYLESIA